MGPIIPAAAGIGLLYLLQHMGSAAGQSASPEDIARRDDNEYKDNPEMDPRAIDARHPQSPQPQAQQEPQNATVQQLEQQMTAADPLPPVTTQALPQQAQRASAVSKPQPAPAPVADNNAPDPMMQRNVAEETFHPATAATAPAAAAAAAANGSDQYGGFQLADLLPLLGATAVGAAQKGVPAPEAQGPVDQNHGPYDTREGPPDDRVGPHDDRIGPHDDRVGPHDDRIGPHDDAFIGPRDDAAIGPKMPPEAPSPSLSITTPEHMKTFSTGGKTYFSDGSNIYNENGQLLGKADKVFGGTARMMLQRAGILARAVK